MQQVLILVVGWLLGLLSPLVFDFFRKGRRHAEARKGVVVELGELRYRLALSTLQLAASAGACDQDFLSWLKACLEPYRGPQQANGRSVLASVDHLLSLDDLQLPAAAKAATPAESSVSLERYELPFLESRMDYVGSLNADAQRSLLEVQAQVRAINELADYVRFCLGKSFDSLPPSTRQAIESSLQGSYRAALARVRQTVDLIGSLNLGRPIAPPPPAASPLSR